MVILSDTFEQFGLPLMEKLNWPTLLCNTLEVGDAMQVPDRPENRPSGPGHI